MNYRQLHYFRAVARAGSIAQAAEQLHLTPQAISGQLAELERYLGVKLFERRGPRLSLTDAGQLALEYAEEIHQLGQQLEAALRSPAGSQRSFRVGIADVVPKAVAGRLLAPLLTQAEAGRLVCHEDKLERLFAELAVHNLDLVIADRPLPSRLGVKGYSHKLGSSPLLWLATPALAERWGSGTTALLPQAPLLLPGSGSVMRAVIDGWLAEQRLKPRIVAEFDDLALMKAFGQMGCGIFPAVAVMAAELQRQYQVVALGALPGVAVSYYAISVERYLTHPALMALTDIARHQLFVEPSVQNVANEIGEGGDHQ